MADQKISDLTAATSVTPADEVPFNDGGTTKKITGANLRAQMQVMRYTYDNSGTSNADPGAGKIRFNNADPASATAIYINDADADGFDRRPLLALNQGSLGVPHIMGYLRIYVADDPTEFLLFPFTRIDTNTGYLEVTIAGGPSALAAVTFPTSAGALVVELDFDNAYYPPEYPFVRSVGAEFSSTGAPSPALPASIQQDDILLCVIQTANQNPTCDWQQIGPKNGIGTAGAAGSTKLSVFWTLAQGGGADVAPTIGDSGDHTYGVIIAIGGNAYQGNVSFNGDVLQYLGGSYLFVADTVAQTENDTKVECDGMLVLDIWAHAIDSASGQGSGYSGTDEVFNDSTSDGNGGGLYIGSMIRDAGFTGGNNVTWGSSTVNIGMRLGIVGKGTVQFSQGTRAPEVQKFIGSAADLDDTWIMPTGGRRVLVQAIGGGASGSAGRNAATAAGGGGGGAGMYAEKWFDPESLSIVGETVHAGRAGAATANSDGAASNAGVASTFASAAEFTANPGQAATASATGAGGAGGAGGGFSSALTPSAGAFANFFGSQPATGGTGGTTAAAGSRANDEGGGGGAGGGTTQGASAGGLARKGGGGGGGGRSNTNVGTGGVGGGGGAGGASAGAAGADSTNLPYGGSGGAGGTSAAGPGGAGGFPGAGGGGGGSQSGAQRGGAGGHGCVVVTTYF